ncbi:TraB/GumN family protein [Oharaeibacter diazotrophicus]|uniref:TraB family protein n=1 Tax=Oharaeibacter diazotrophicus TaxID=1920512 RepID=A0A4R6RI82_9HYPH|nr:TraB/GumN family protein [Oharaeibacter diazotrophicus]TDP85567.1 hypothetical protein EDD54_2421 [Oharaeibacter diazotrophicus]BBE74538.1 TraB family protein [Pleomorphomonas sp. SM30]GLS75763.1 hypothetical protein GCM10007904_10980 [Oharaeibacter diazotrophicus]
MQNRPGRAAAPHRWRTLAAAAAIVAGVAPAAADPALWVARDADSTVWLLGTVHVLETTREWHTAAIDDAFDASDELWLEIDLLNDDSAGFLAMAKHGTSPDRSLTSRLSAAERAKLDRVAAAAGMTVASLEGLRPWLAAVQLTVGLAKGAGLDGPGTDLQLARLAAMRDKPIRAFETGEAQLKLFSSLTDEQELALLRQTLDEAEGGAATLRRLVAAWASGDVDTLETIGDGAIRDSDPGAYEALIVRRNRAFADRIAALMAGSGTAFVAVGAAHLGGPDSVQRLLADKGVATERVE